VLCLLPDLNAASPVGVYLEFEHTPSPIAMEAMRKEATHALGQIGFSIAWRLVSENQGNEAFENIVVVKFTGSCACQSSAQPTRDILVLGSTTVLHDQVLPYSEVRCDAVRRVLPGLEFSADRGKGDAALGRVLGRVLAHELYHVLGGTTHHADTGIAKAVQSTDELTSADFSFGP
jgi:hypothetical protein